MKPIKTDEKISKSIEKSMEKTNQEEQIDTKTPDVDAAVDKVDKSSKSSKPTESEAPKQKKIQMPLTYSEDNYKYNLFDEIGCHGDNMIAHKMKQISNKNREAMDNFSRTYTKYSNINYFEQELNDAAASRWWDNDTELEKKF